MACFLLYFSCTLRSALSCSLEKQSVIDVPTHAVPTPRRRAVSNHLVGRSGITEWKRSFKSDWWDHA